MKARSCRFSSKSRAIRSSPRAKDRKSTRLNSSHLVISYAVFCLKKKIICLAHKLPDPPRPHLRTLAPHHRLCTGHSTPSLPPPSQRYLTPLRVTPSEHAIQHTH